MASFSFSNEHERMTLARAVCAVGEGATVASPAPAAARHLCVAAVLADPWRRCTQLGGREGMPRSFGSVYSAYAVLFLGSTFRGIESAVHDGHAQPWSSGFAVSNDGATMLVSDYGNDTVCIASVADGAHVCTIGICGNMPLEFFAPRQVWIARDDFVFVAESGNDRIQVLTPQLDFYGFIGEGRLDSPFGVCASGDVIVVAERSRCRVQVFTRPDGAFSHDFGAQGVGAGELLSPVGLCFMADDTAIAVVEWGGDRVSVFRVDGTFVHHVGVGVLYRPRGAACSDCDELVVADTGNRRVAIFSASGGFLKTIGTGLFTSVAVHGASVFAHTSNLLFEPRDCRCVTFA
jgi:DNA-binding beta-propeller fold protein YncE